MAADLKSEGDMARGLRGCRDPLGKAQSPAEGICFKVWAASLPLNALDWVLIHLFQLLVAPISASAVT
jgi:hypothetical protein